MSTGPQPIGAVPITFESSIWLSDREVAECLAALGQLVRWSGRAREAATLAAIIRQLATGANRSLDDIGVTLHRQVVLDLACELVTAADELRAAGSYAVAYGAEGIAGRLIDQLIGGGGASA
jgi:hypothetical protein